MFAWGHIPAIAEAGDAVVDMAEDMVDGMAGVMEHGIEEATIGEGRIIMAVLDIIPFSPITVEDITHTHFTMDTILTRPGTEKQAHLIQMER